MSAPLLSAFIQGQGSVSADNLNTFEQTCDTLTQLAQFVGLPGMQVFSRGSAISGDGGGGIYYWAVGSFTGDGVNVIVPVGAASGAWIKINNSSAPPVVPALVTTSGTTISSKYLFYPIDNTTGSPFTINLPLTPITGEIHIIKDWAGNAGANNITINGNGFNIDNSSVFTLSFNYQSVSLIFSFGKWSVV